MTLEKLRPSGLILPPTRRYEDSTRLVTGLSGIEGYNPTVQYVILLDDLTRVGNTVAQATAPPTPTTPGPAGTPPASTSKVGLVQIGARTALRWIRPQLVQSGTVPGGIQTIVFSQPMYLRGAQCDFQTGAGAQAGLPNHGFTCWLAAPNAAELAAPFADDTDPNCIAFTKDVAAVASTRYVMTLGEAPSPRLINSAVALTDLGYFSELNHDGISGNGQVLGWFHMRAPNVPIMGFTVVTAPNANPCTTGFWANFESA